MGPRTGLDGCGKSHPPTGIRSSERPAPTESLDRLSYPGTSTTAVHNISQLQASVFLICRSVRPGYWFETFQKGVPQCSMVRESQKVSSRTHHHHHHYHYHYHVPEVLGVFPVPWSSKWSWSLHLFFGRPMFLRPFSLYRNVCFGILFLSILCTCCSHLLLRILRVVFAVPWIGYRPVAGWV